jgi:hypothetical protein
MRRDTSLSKVNDYGSIGEFRFTTGARVFVFVIRSRDQPAYLVDIETRSPGEKTPTVHEIFEPQRDEAYGQSRYYTQRNSV